MRSPRGFRASLAWAGALLAALALQQAALAGVVRESCGLIAVAEDGSFIDTDLMGMGVEAYAGGEPATRVNAMCQGQSINLSKRMQKLEGASSGRACVIDTRDGRRCSTTDFRITVGPSGHVLYSCHFDFEVEGGTKMALKRAESRPDAAQAVAESAKKGGAAVSVCVTAPASPEPEPAPQPSPEPEHSPAPEAPGKSDEAKERKQEAPSHPEMPSHPETPSEPAHGLYKSWKQAKRAGVAWREWRAMKTAAGRG